MEMHQWEDPVRRHKRIGEMDYIFVLDEKKKLHITALERESKRTWTGLFHNVLTTNTNGPIILLGDTLYRGLTKPKRSGVTAILPDSVPEGEFIIKLVIPGGSLGEQTADLLLNEKDITHWERLEVRIKDLEEEVDSLKKMYSSPIIGVTTFTDSLQKLFDYAAEHIMIEFDVEKKDPNSILVIQGTLALHGENYAETTYEWVYGNTAVLAQAEGFVNNSGYNRAIPTSAVISGHTKTGVQKLSLKWRMKNGGRGRPCNSINPDGSQHVQLRKSSSVIVVMEILNNDSVYLNSLTNSI